MSCVEAVVGGFVCLGMPLSIHTSGTRAQDHTHMSGKPFWEAEFGGLGSKRKHFARANLRAEEHQAQLKTWFLIVEKKIMDDMFWS